MFPLSVSICRWVPIFFLNCWAHSGDACCLREYSVVCLGLDQNMARLVRPWTLFGQHPTANMSVLNCWKDIGTTNIPRSRWVWHSPYCSALHKISIYWRTPILLGPTLSTAAASFIQISIWGTQTSRSMPGTLTPPSWWSRTNDPHWMRLQMMPSLHWPSSDD